MQEPDYKLMIMRIGCLIEDTIPNPSEISVVDAVALLVRENNALRQAVGLPTYRTMAEKEQS